MENETHCENDTWAKWKRGSMIGAAALTGGTIFAVTGGTMLSPPSDFPRDIS